MFVYGYCRISTPQQNIERQVRNIAAAYPAAHIVREVYTGTACQGRRELDKLLRIVQEGDTIVFDSVSRMSRSADEGCALYETLYKRGVNLCFLKEPHINIKKAAAAKALILKHSRDFNGTLADADCIKLIGIARNTYYKYKRELRDIMS